MCDIEYKRFVRTMPRERDSIYGRVGRGGARAVFFPEEWSLNAACLFIWQSCLSTSSSWADLQVLRPKPELDAADELRRHGIMRGVAESLAAGAEHLTEKGKIERLCDSAD